ncbi:MAG: hypothetical protein VXX85_07260 [Candidatus Margulisiibacteriota bacterium]|nr:hypothetical protein [Candidatus Margulisiibacteriota bacterium]
MILIGYSILNALAFFIICPKALNITYKEFSKTYSAAFLAAASIISVILSSAFNLFDPLFLPWLLSLYMLSIFDFKDHSVRLVDLFISTGLVLPLLDFNTLVPQFLLTGVIICLLLGLKYGLKAFYGQDAFGGADIWLIALILIALKGPLALVAIYVAIIASAVVGLFLLIFKKKSRRTYVPFIPFLNVGVVVALLKGTYLLNLYMSFITIK